jgi:hypothetical protein
MICSIGGFLFCMPSLGFSGFVFGASILLGVCAALQLTKRLL